MTVKPRQAPGFTLLELLVVLFLLGVIYALTGPMLDAGNTGINVRAAAQQVAAGLRKARSIAVTERREAALTLDVEGRRFSVDGDPKTYHLPKGLELSLFTAQSEVLAERVARIRFYPDGSSTGGRVTVSAGGNKLSVDVDWLTGRTKFL